MNAQETCRVCLSRCSELTPLRVRLPDKNKTFEETINFVVNINILLDNGLPDKICKDCGTMLDVADTFKQRCLESEAMLGQLDKEKGTDEFRPKFEDKTQENSKIYSEDLPTVKQCAPISDSLVKVKTEENVHDFSKHKIKIEIVEHFNDGISTTEHENLDNMQDFEAPLLKVKKEFLIKEEIVEIPVNYVDSKDSLLEPMKHSDFSSRESLESHTKDKRCSKNSILDDIQPSTSGLTMATEEQEETNYLTEENMSSSSEDESPSTPPEISEEANLVTEQLLPQKSREKYKKSYEDFLKWRTVNNVNSFSENVLLAYFNKMSKNKMPTTLWCEYSKLKTNLRLKHNVCIENYTKLSKFLKRKSDGYKPKKSKVFSGDNIDTFIKGAPDEQYLLDKVVLIFGLNGACRSNELTNLTTNDVETYNDKMIVHLRCTKTKEDRMFVVQEKLLDYVQKYENLRPTNIKTDRYFVNFKNGKCTKQVVGRHKIAAIPKRIATYLNLPDAGSYTGFCFRRTSTTVLADIGAKTILKSHSGWSSDNL